MSIGMLFVWLEYVINVLIESGYVFWVVIVGSDGCWWVVFFILELFFIEVKVIVNGFVELNSFCLDGILFCGKFYMCMRMDSVVMVGWEGVLGLGCIVYWCRNLLVIGVYEDGVYLGGCYNMICKVGDYLWEYGFWKILRVICGNFLKIIWVWFF